MKKLILALVVIFLCFSGCRREADWENLYREDVWKSWESGSPLLSPSEVQHLEKEGISYDPATETLYRMGLEYGAFPDLEEGRFLISSVGGLMTVKDLEKGEVLFWSISVHRDGIDGRILASSDTAEVVQFKETEVWQFGRKVCTMPSEAVFIGEAEECPIFLEKGNLYCFEKGTQKQIYENVSEAKIENGLLVFTVQDGLTSFDFCYTNGEVRPHP